MKRRRGKLLEFVLQQDWTIVEFGLLSALHANQTTCRLDKIFVVWSACNSKFNLELQVKVKQNVIGHLQLHRIFFAHFLMSIKIMWSIKCSGLAKGFP